MTPLSQRLTQLRKENKVSLQEVADSLGISKPHVWELEKGKSKNPSADILVGLSRYYNVSVDYLLGLEDTKGEVLTGMVRGLSDKEIKLVEVSVKNLINVMRKVL